MKTQALINSVVLTALGAALAAQADVVTDWNNAALNAIRADKTPPPKASRGLAILHITIFDTVNGIKGSHEQKFDSYLVRTDTKDNASEEAAVSAAAHLVLLKLFPAWQATFDTAYATALEAIPRHKSKDRGIAWGEFVANAILAARANDSSTAVVAPPSSSGPGFWVPTPPAFAAYLLPQWGFVTPFAMTDHLQFRPPGPPALNTAKWTADYNEVKALGAAVGSTRTTNQSQIALFWADGNGTETPPGHWNRITQAVGAAQGNTLEENARLFALLNIAMADAAICAWDAKYYFNSWRPVSAIRNGDTDGNAATDPVPAWSSFLVTPPFPGYISGHSTFSGAAATVLALFYGTDDISFTTGSDFLPGVFRSFNSFSAAADEAAISRLYGGIHSPSDTEDCLASGLRIGEWTIIHCLKPKGNRSRTPHGERDGEHGEDNGQH